MPAPPGHPPHRPRQQIRRRPDQPPYVQPAPARCTSGRRTWRGAATGGARSPRVGGLAYPGRWSYPCWGQPLAGGSAGGTSSRSTARARSCCGVLRRSGVRGVVVLHRSAAAGVVRSRRPSGRQRRGLRYPLTSGWFLTPGRSRHQVAHHRVGEQTTSPGEHHPTAPLPGASSPRPPGPAATRPASSSTSPAAPRPAGSRAGSAPRAGSRRRAPRAPGPGSAPAREPVGVRRGVLDVPPAHPADVGVGAGPDPPPVASAPVEEVVPAPRRLVRGPSSTARTSAARPRSAPRRPAGTCRRGRRRPAPAARRGAPAGPARCPPRRSARTPTRGPGAQASAASRDRRQSSRVSPGVP